MKPIALAILFSSNLFWCFAQPLGVWQKQTMQVCYNMQDISCFTDSEIDTKISHAVNKIRLYNVNNKYSLYANDVKKYALTIPKNG